MTNLNGKTILYTRSKAHYPAFAAAIQSCGGIPLHLPLLDTRPLAYPAISTADALIFTSVAAVQHFDHQQIPSKAQLIAIGPATAAALPHVDLIAPAPYNSEALLRSYTPRNQHIILIAGKGGRNLLQNTLATHNHITKLEVYERINPSSTWPYPSTQRIDAITLASEQTLKHLIEIAPQNVLKLLQCHSQIITLSERISQAARAHGFRHVHSAAHADETAQLATLFQVIGAHHE